MIGTSWLKFIVALLAICCAVLTYRVIDQGITMTYLNASQETSARHIKLLAGLIEHDWIGISEKQVIARLNAYVASQPPGSIILKRDPGSKVVYLEGIRFEFSNGKLDKVL